MSIEPTKIPRADELVEYAELLRIKPDDPLQPESKPVDAAAADIPLILHSVPKGERDPYLPHGSPDPNSTVLSASNLIEALVARGHRSLVASWAIYRCIVRGFLGAETAVINVPRGAISIEAKYRDPVRRLRERVETYQVSVSMKPGPVYATPDHVPGVREPGESYVSRKYLVVWPNEVLWDWWKHNAGAALALSDTTSTSELTFSQPRGPKDWAKVFRVSYDTMKKMLKEQTVRNQHVSPRRYRICIDDLPPSTR